MNDPPLFIELFHSPLSGSVPHPLGTAMMPAHDQGSSYWTAVGRAQRLEAAIRQIIREELAQTVQPHT